MLLFQVPVVNDHYSSRRDRCQTESCEARTEGNFESHSVRSLCILAKNVLCLVLPSDAEELSEALRLHRIKTIAARYNIASFDPSNKMQVKAAANIICCSSVVNESTKGPDLQSLLDALELVSLWGEDSPELSGLFTRTLVDRATSPRYVDACGDEDSASRFHAVKDVFSVVPRHRLQAVVEDTCTYFIDELSWVREEAKFACDDTVSEYLNSLESQIAALCLVRGIICVTSIYLDDQLSSKNSISQIENCQGASARKLLEQTSTIVNNDMLLCAKRLRLLYTEHQLVISMSELRNPVFCRDFLQQFAHIRASQLIENFTTIQDSSNCVQTNASCKLGKSNPLTPELRRVCAILNISTIVFSHMVIKTLIAQGHQVRSMLSFSLSTIAIESLVIFERFTSRPQEVAMQSAQTLQSENWSFTEAITPFDNEALASTRPNLQTGKEVNSLLEVVVTVCSVATQKVVLAIIIRHFSYEFILQVCDSFICS